MCCLPVLEGGYIQYGEELERFSSKFFRNYNVCPIFSNGNFQELAYNNRNMNPRNKNLAKFVHSSGGCQSSPKWEERVFFAYR